MNFAIHDQPICGRPDLLNATSREIKENTDMMLRWLEHTGDGPFVLTIYLFKGEDRSEIDFPTRAKRMGLQSPTEETVVAKWYPTGVGAGLMAWMDGEIVSAVSVVCSGLNFEADEAAIAGIVDGFGASPGIVTTLREINRPFISTVYGQLKSLTHLKVCPLAIGFAQAFYTRLDRHLPPAGVG
jgi:hypothetical protein